MRWLMRDARAQGGTREPRAGTMHTPLHIISGVDSSNEVIDDHAVLLKPFRFHHPAECGHSK